MAKQENVNLTWLGSFNTVYLHLILFITEKCNFRCTYCYEDFKLGKIDDDVVEGVKNLIISRAKDLSYLKISFFGGEPLLNKRSVFDIAKWAQDICHENNIKFMSDVTTNGYLLNTDTFNVLCDNGVLNYQITLDGNKKTHDKLRPTAGGKPTYDVIMENLQNMKISQRDFQCMIRINVADYNIQSAYDFFNENQNLFSNDKRFLFHLHPIFGMVDLSLTKNSLKSLTEHVKSLGLFYGEGKTEENVCYASRADSYVIRSNGVIQKCTVAVNSDINTIGKIHKDGTMELDQEKLKKWIFAENKKCPVISLQNEKLLNAYEDAGKYVDEPDNSAEE